MSLEHVAIDRHEALSGILEPAADFKNFPDPVAALDEMHRVLRPAGQAWMFDMRKDAPPEAIQQPGDEPEAAEEGGRVAGEVLAGSGDVGPFPAGNSEMAKLRSAASASGAVPVWVVPASSPEALSRTRS